MQTGIQRPADRGGLTRVGWRPKAVPRRCKTVFTAIVRPRRAAWLAGLCSPAGAGVSAAPAQALTYSQQTLPFSELSYPYGVAVDGSSDVFVTDAKYNRVVELTSSPIASGALAFSPSSGPAASTIGVSSVTPCPLGGAFGSTGAKLVLYSATSTVTATATAGLDSSGDWSGTPTVPSNAANGTYLFGARCAAASGLRTQSYASAAFTLPAANSGAQGPAGPSGPQRPPGTNGTTDTTGAAGINGAAGVNGAAGTNGTNGGVGPAGTQGATGPQGAAGSAAAKLISSQSRCTTTVRLVTTCPVTYQYSTTGAAADGQVTATATIHGRATKTIGRGPIHHHKIALKVTLRHLHRERYHHLTLFELTTTGCYPIACTAHIVATIWQTIV